MPAAAIVAAASRIIRTERLLSAGCRLTSWMLSPVTAGSALFSLMMSFVQCAPAMLFVRWVGTALLRIAATVLVRSSMAPKELQAPACLGENR